MLVDESESDHPPVWTWRDRMVVQAFEVYEATLCDGCRQRRARSFNPHMAGRFQVLPQTCYGCAALEQTRKGQKDTLGVKNFVVDAGPDDLPIHEMRLEPIDQELYDELTGGLAGVEQ